jgi:hypothetical protein
MAIHAQSIKLSAENRNISLFPGGADKHLKQRIASRSGTIFAGFATSQWKLRGTTAPGGCQPRHGGRDDDRLFRQPARQASIPVQRA